MKKVILPIIVIFICIPHLRGKGIKKNVTLPDINGFFKLNGKSVSGQIKISQKDMLSFFGFQNFKGENLKKLPLELKSLYIQGAQVTDDHFIHIKKLVFLGRNRYTAHKYSTKQLFSGKDERMGKVHSVLVAYRIA